VIAKAGLNDLTRALAVELAAKSITVNAVVPGMIATQQDRPTQHHHASNETLVRRRGLPEEFAAAVRFLAGPKPRYVTGRTLRVDGGAYLGRKGSRKILWLVMSAPALINCGRQDECCCNAPELPVSRDAIVCDA
jgi:enoyl-[acyl-carrier-protein] reductase (NADH)